MFHLDKVHIILDEMILNGHIVETNKNRILAPLLALDKMADGWMRQLHFGNMDFMIMYMHYLNMPHTYLTLALHMLTVHNLSFVIHPVINPHCMTKIQAAEWNTVHQSYFANILMIILEHTDLKIFVYFKLQLELNKCL